MKKPYEKYVKRSEVVFWMSIAILFSSFMNAKSIDTFLFSVLVSVFCLGLYVYCSIKEAQIDALSKMNSLKSEE